MARLTFPKVEHPDFKYLFEGGVFVFERQQYRPPTKRQEALYTRNEQIVKKHGGRMRLQLYQIAGENPVFTRKDVEEMKRAVEAAGYRVRDQWNGAGCYSCSIRAERRK